MGWCHKKTTFSCFLFFASGKNGSQASNGACEVRPPALGKEIAFRYQVSSNGHSAVLFPVSAPHTLISCPPPVSCYLSLVKLSTSTSPLVCSSSPMAYHTSEEHLISWETNLHPQVPRHCHPVTWVFSTGELCLAPPQTPQLLLGSHLTH